jgi:hypothetical protein
MHASFSSTRPILLTVQSPRHPPPPPRTWLSCGVGPVRCACSRSKRHCLAVCAVNSFFFSKIFYFERLLSAPLTHAASFAGDLKDIDTREVCPVLTTYTAAATTAGADLTAASGERWIEGDSFLPFVSILTLVCSCAQVI